ncbi:MAG: hypothetical protein R3F65_14195 [bacterium]
MALLLDAGVLGLGGDAAEERPPRAQIGLEGHLLRADAGGEQGRDGGAMGLVGDPAERGEEAAERDARLAGHAGVTGFEQIRDEVIGRVGRHHVAGHLIDAAREAERGEERERADRRGPLGPPARVLWSSS